MVHWPEYLTQEACQKMVAAALAEDIGTGDITAALLPQNPIVTATLLTREAGVLCGTVWAEMAFTAVDSTVQCQWHRSDGDTLAPNERLLSVTGPAQSILTAERVALNFLQLLSGTATLTAQYVEAVRGTSARIYDTRKTIPGLRYAQKYAVLCGGGFNHRLGLFDAILVKENHLASTDMTTLISTARQKTLPIEIEVESLEEYQKAVSLKPDIILLDNFSSEMLKAAVEHPHDSILLEASGGVDIKRVRQIAETGVDRIAIGALTKQLSPLDLSLLVD